MWIRTEAKDKGTLKTIYSYDGSESVIINKITIENLMDSYFIYFSGPKELSIYNLITESKQFFPYTLENSPYPPVIRNNLTFCPGVRIAISKFKNKNESDFYGLLQCIFSEMQKYDPGFEPVIPLVHKDLSTKIDWIQPLSFFSDKNIGLGKNDYTIDEKSTFSDNKKFCDYNLFASSSSSLIQSVCYQKTECFEYDHNFGKEFTYTAHIWKVVFNNMDEATRFYLTLEDRISAYREKLHQIDVSENILNLQGNAIIICKFPVFSEAFRLLSELKLCPDDSLGIFQKKTGLDVCVSESMTNYECK